MLKRRRNSYRKSGESDVAVELDEHLHTDYGKMIEDGRSVDLRTLVRRHRTTRRLADQAVRDALLPHHWNRSPSCKAPGRALARPGGCFLLAIRRVSRGKIVVSLFADLSIGTSCHARRICQENGRYMPLNKASQVQLT